MVFHIQILVSKPTREEENSYANFKLWKTLQKRNKFSAFYLNKYTGIPQPGGYVLELHQVMQCYACTASLLHVSSSPHGRQLLQQLLTGRAYGMAGHFRA